MASNLRTVTTFSLPAGMASALAAEAERRDSTPSRVLEELLINYLPEYVSRAIQATLEKGTAT